jgi:transposase
MPIPALLPSANKSKVAILPVITGQMSVSEVCTRYGVNRSWVYKLLKRYEQSGIAGLEPAGEAPLRALVRPSAPLSPSPASFR